MNDTPEGVETYVVDAHALVWYITGDSQLFRATLTLPGEWEIHDRIIAATGQHYGAPIIAKDAVLQRGREVQTVW